MQRDTSHGPVCFSNLIGGFHPRKPTTVPQDRCQTFVPPQQGDFDNVNGHAMPCKYSTKAYYVNIFYAKGLRPSDPHHIKDIHGSKSPPLLIFLSEYLLCYPPTSSQICSSNSFTNSIIHPPPLLFPQARTSSFFFSSRRQSGRRVPSPATRTS